MESISTRQVAARIRCGTLLGYSKGYPVCACHPDKRSDCTTESLRFWSKGDRIMCPVSHTLAPALAVFPELGITIDTRL